MSDTRLDLSERLHALAQLLPMTSGRVSAKDAIVRIASESYGRRGQSLSRDEMITLAREVCTANDLPYGNGSR